MKDIKRSIRRHNSERMRNRAKRLMPNYPSSFKIADNMARCSCNICGNPRHNEFNKTKITIPEYQHELRLYEQISELENTFYKIKNRKKDKKNLY